MAPLLFLFGFIIALVGVLRGLQPPPVAKGKPAPWHTIPIDAQVQVRQVILPRWRGKVVISWPGKDPFIAVAHNRGRSVLHPRADVKIVDLHGGAIFIDKR